VSCYIWLDMTLDRPYVCNVKVPEAIIKLASSGTQKNGFKETDKKQHINNNEDPNN